MEKGRAVKSGLRSYACNRESLVIVVSIHSLGGALDPSQYMLCRGYRFYVNTNCPVHRDRPSSTLSA